MMWKRQSSVGFTIVELLIVIVVIGILAAITIVAYNGVQSRARDSERQTEMKSIEKALEMYNVDNGGYPTCSGTTYVAGGVVSGCSMASLASALVPKYLSSLPTDPINSANDVYRYAVGYQKTSSTAFSNNQTSNYITGMHLETVSGNINAGWVSPAYYNYLGGSSN
jgi:type II secretion system protein G